MRGDMWEPPFTGQTVTFRRIMVGYPGQPPVVIQQVTISREEDGATTYKGRVTSRS